MQKGGSLLFTPSSQSSGDAVPCFLHLCCCPYHSNICSLGWGQLQPTPLEARHLLDGISLHWLCRPSEVRLQVPTDFQLALRHVILYSFPGGSQKHCRTVQIARECWVSIAHGLACVRFSHWSKGVTRSEIVGVYLMSSLQRGSRIQWNSERIVIVLQFSLPIPTPASIFLERWC